MNTPLILILAVANVPLYLVLGKSFFRDWAGFAEAARFWFTPDIISVFRNEYNEDRWETGKLFVFLLVCILIVAAEYTSIQYYF